MSEKDCTFKKGRAVIGRALGPSVASMVPGGTRYSSQFLFIVLGCF